MVAGNWKMNGSLASSCDLLEKIEEQSDSIKGVDIAVFAPYIYLPAVCEKLKSSSIITGAQNLCKYDSGAYTGEVSASMLQDFSVDAVILGHSERRHVFGESSADVAEKVKIAVAAEITPVFCVGEKLEERERGKTEAVILEQMNAVIDLCGVEIFSKVIVAYEPVWAIGTGITATPEQAQEVHAYIRGLIAEQNSSIAADLRLLYGGSVKPDNAKGLFSMNDIDGGLIGGASLKAEDFISICKSAID